MHMYTLPFFSFFRLAPVGRSSQIIQNFCKKPQFLEHKKVPHHRHGAHKSYKNKSLFAQLHNVIIAYAIFNLDRQVRRLIPGLPEKFLKSGPVLRDLVFFSSFLFSTLPSTLCICKEVYSVLVVQRVEWSIVVTSLQHHFLSLLCRRLPSPS